MRKTWGVLAKKREEKGNVKHFGTDWRIILKRIK